MYVKKMEKEYLKQLTDDEKKTMEIAKKILGDSLSIHKSIGFQEYLKRLKTRKLTDTTCGTKPS